MKETSRIFSPAISSIVAYPDSSKPYIWASAGLKTALDILIYIRLIGIALPLELRWEIKVKLAAAISVGLVKIPLNFLSAFFAVKPYTKCVLVMTFGMAAEYIRTIILVFNRIWREVSHTDETLVPSKPDSKSSVQDQV